MGAMSNIFRIFLSICSILLVSCFGPFVGRKPEGPPRPPELDVQFDSVAATAGLAWSQGPAKGFVRYEVQRSTGAEFKVVAEQANPSDTSYVDLKLSANKTYVYRIVCAFEDPKDPEKPLQFTTSTQIKGGIHRFAGAWTLPDESGPFHPTRLVVDRAGTVSVVGIGTGRLLRYDRSGNLLSTIEFSDQPLALLETGALDGPSLALDGQDNVYVVFNVLGTNGPPQAFWSKFDRDGRPLWKQPLEGLFARHIAVDRKDHPFIESISRLQQFSPNGDRLAHFGIPALLVSSLRFWKDSFAALVESVHLVEGEWRAPRLVVYEGLERTTTSITMGRDPLSEEDRGNGLLFRPTDFAVDAASSRAFVVNAGRSRIEVFRNGRYLTKWGIEGTGFGQFRFSGAARVVDELESSSLAVRDVVTGGIARDVAGNLYVADTYNNRIQKFLP